MTTRSTRNTCPLKVMLRQLGLDGVLPPHGASLHDHVEDMVRRVVKQYYLNSQTMRPKDTKAEDSTRDAYIMAEIVDHPDLKDRWNPTVPKKAIVTNIAHLWIKEKSKLENSMRRSKEQDYSDADEDFDRDTDTASPKPRIARRTADAPTSRNEKKRTCSSQEPTGTGSAKKTRLQRPRGDVATTETPDLVTHPLMIRSMTNDVRRTEEDTIVNIKMVDGTYRIIRSANIGLVDMISPAAPDVPIEVSNTSLATLRQTAEEELEGLRYHPYTLAVRGTGVGAFDTVQTDRSLRASLRKQWLQGDSEFEILFVRKDGMVRTSPHVHEHASTSPNLSTTTGKLGRRRPTYVANEARLSQPKTQTHKIVTQGFFEDGLTGPEFYGRLNSPFPPRRRQGATHTKATECAPEDPDSEPERSEDAVASLHLDNMDSSGYYSEQETLGHGYPDCLDGDDDQSEEAAAEEGHARALQALSLSLDSERHGRDRSVVSRNLRQTPRPGRPVESVVDLTMDETDASTDSPPESDTDEEQAVKAAPSKPVNTHLSQDEALGNGDGPVEYNDDDNDQDDNDYNQDGGADVRQAKDLAAKCMNLPRVSQLTENNVVEYCKMFGLDASRWDPQSPAALPGMRVLRGDDNASKTEFELTQCQLWTAFKLISHASTYNSALSNPEGEDNGIVQHLPALLGHEPGLGKTACVITKWVLNMLLRRCAIDVKTSRQAKDGKHLALDAEAGGRCPRRMKFGFVCSCEPDSIAAQLIPLRHATVVVVPPSLLWGWESEWLNIVDREKLAELGVEETTLYMGYKAGRSKKKTPIFQEHAARHTVQPYTLDDWMKANPGIPDDQVMASRVQHAYGTLNHPPLREEPDSAHLFILSTPICLETQVFAAAKVTFFPKVANFKWPCAGPDGCLKNDTAKAGKHAATHTGKCDRREMLGLRFSEVVADEFHSYSSESTGFLRHFKAANQAQLSRYGVGIALVPCSGTPFTHGPCGPMPFYEAQRADWWASIPDLQPWTESMSKDCARAWGAMHTVKDTGRVPATLFVDLFRGDYAALCPYPKETAKDPTLAQQALARLFETHFRGFLEDWLAKHTLRLLASDEYAGHPMKALPALTKKTMRLSFAPEQVDTLAGLVKLYNQTKKVAAAMAEPRNKVEKQEAAHKKKVVLRLNRAVLSCLCIPQLCKILDYEGGAREALAKTIREGGWWQKPRRSPYYAHAQAIYDSSPKLQEIVRRIAARPSEEYVVNATEVETSKLNPDPAKWVDEKHGKRKAKMVIFVHEPVLALCLCIVLTSGQVAQAVTAVGRSKVEAYRALEPGFDAADRERLVKRLQDKPIAESPKVTFGDPLDILIVLARAGAVGITLTKAHTVLLFDIDTSPSRAEQAPKRCHRVGQRNEVKCTQLVMRDWGIEEDLVRRRNAGVDMTNELLEVKVGGGEEADGANGGG